MGSALSAGLTGLNEAQQMIRRSDVAAYLSESKLPTIMYHVTNPNAEHDIRTHGIDLDRGGGAFGGGLYLSTRPEMDFGTSVIEVAADIRNPLLVHQPSSFRYALEELWKQPGVADKTIAAVQADQGCRLLVHAAAPGSAQPLAPVEVTAMTNTRHTLMAGGYDGVMITNQADPGAATWAVAIKENSARLVADDAPRS